MGHFYSKIEVGLELYGGPYDETLRRRRVQMVELGRPVLDANGDDVDYFTLRVETDTESFTTLQLIPHDDSSSEASETEQAPLFTIRLEDGNVDRLVAALAAARDLRRAPGD